MIIAGEYSFNGGTEYIQQHHAERLQEVKNIIAAVDATVLKRKKSKEKTKKDRMLYSPSAMNKAFKREFNQLGWKNQTVRCDYPATYYTQDYNPPGPLRGVRDMDFLKGGVGI